MTHKNFLNKFASLSKEKAMKVQPLVSMLAMSLIVAVCTKRSAQETAGTQRDVPWQPADITQTPVKPDQPEGQVNTSPEATKLRMSFRGGSLYANEESSVAANEQMNAPRRRERAQTWTDKQGRFWLFGGRSADNFLQDLWLFNSQTQTWTNFPAEADKQPPSRAGGISWVDDDGSLHLAGGEAVENGQRLARDDHWIFRQDSRIWSRVLDENRDYLRVHGAVVQMIGHAGFLFGGYQLNESGGVLYKNDLWKLVNAGQDWQLVQEESSTGSTEQRPTARSSSSLWFDKKGTLWLHAGFGNDQADSQGHLNDLWAYDVNAKTWTLVFGSQLAPSCVADFSEQSPLPRSGAVHWTGSDGQLWLLGGESAALCGPIAFLNDLWRFDPERKTWNLLQKRSVNPHALYEASESRLGLGGRSFASAWFDRETESLWLFGGFGYASDYMPGELRDLWKFGQEPGL